MNVREILEEWNKIEQRLEISERRVIIETDQFDNFDWSDIELSPQDLPKWVQSELNSNIPSFATDGDILPRYVGNFIFLVKYNKILALDYIVIAIEKIHKD